MLVNARKQVIYLRLWIINIYIAQTDCDKNEATVVRYQEIPPK